MLSRTVGRSPGAGGGGGGGAGNDGAELLLSVTPFPVKTNVFCILCTERALFARNYNRKINSGILHSPKIHLQNVLFAISQGGTLYR